MVSLSLMCSELTGLCLTSSKIYVVKNDVQYIRESMVALREAVISKYIRGVTLRFVPSDTPTETVPTTTARFPALPNLDVSDLEDHFLQDRQAGKIHSMATSKPKFHLSRFLLFADS